MQRRFANAILLTDFDSSSDLLPQVKKLVGNGMRPADVVWTPQLIASCDTGHRYRYRSQPTLRRFLARSTTSGERSCTLARGTPLDVSALFEGRALAQTAAANGVRVFVVDARMVNEDTVTPTDPRLNEYVTATRTSLRVIAEQSGGFAFDRDELPAALDHISNSTR